MAEKSDVENWLSSLSYQELRKLAGEYGFKKNQKVRNLVLCYHSYFGRVFLIMVFLVRNKW